MWSTVEAFLTYNFARRRHHKLVARAGVWPPVRLNHNRPEWRVRDTITPSAINSWIGDEVKLGGTRRK